MTEDRYLLHPIGVVESSLTDPANPPRGVFSTRSPARPNPIRLHLVEIVAVNGTRMRVKNLEATDGTPILDVKPPCAGVSDS